MWTRCLSLTLVSFALACTVESGDTTDTSTTVTESTPGTSTQPTTAPATETGTDDTSTADTGTTDTGAADTSTADTSTADTGTEDTGPENTSAGGLSFAADVYEPIISIKCGCHMVGAGGMVMGADATSAYAVLVGVPSEDVPALSRVEPGDPTISYMFHKISGTQLDVGGMGSKMPLGDMLTPDQVAVIEQWILDGAQP